MSDSSNAQIPAPNSPPSRGTPSLLEYFWSTHCDFRLFHFILDTVMVGDYAAYVAGRALDGTKDEAITEPVELAKKQPGNRTTRLRQSSQELLEMFLGRAIDNFQIYLVEVIRAVLQKRPEILSASKRELSLGHILSFASIEDLVQDLVEAKVLALSYEGFGELQEWCDERGIPLLVPSGQRERVVELIATRNLIVHTRGIVDTRYLKGLSNSKFRVGQKRELDVDNLFPAFELLGRIVNITDVAISGKFDLPSMDVSSELKARSLQRWPSKTLPRPPAANS